MVRENKTWKNAENSHVSTEFNSLISRISRPFVHWISWVVTPWVRLLHIFSCIWCVVKSFSYNNLSSGACYRSQQMPRWFHCVQTVLHVLQVTVSMLLMLVFMTYNVWLCLSVIAGAGTGYFLFGWRRYISSTDVRQHCHWSWSTFSLRATEYFCIIYPRLPTAECVPTMWSRGLRRTAYFCDMNIIT